MQRSAWNTGLWPHPGLILSQLFPGSPPPLNITSHSTAGPFTAICAITPSLPYTISPSSKSPFFLSYPLQRVLPLSSHPWLLPESSSLLQASVVQRIIRVTGLVHLSSSLYLLPFLPLRAGQSSYLPAFWEHNTEPAYHMVGEALTEFD